MKPKRKSRKAEERRGKGDEIITYGSSSMSVSMEAGAEFVWNYFMPDDAFGYER